MNVVDREGVVVGSIDRVAVLSVIAGEDRADVVTWRCDAVDPSPSASSPPTKAGQLAGCAGSCCRSSFAAIIVVGYAIGHDVPTWLDAHVKRKGRRGTSGTQIHSDTNWFFVNVFGPIGDPGSRGGARSCGCSSTCGGRASLALVGVIGYLTAGGARRPVTGIVVLAGWALGYWDNTMITLSLMLVSVFIRAADRHPTRHLGGPVGPRRAFDAWHPRHGPGDAGVRLHAAARGGVRHRRARRRSSPP